MSSIRRFDYNAMKRQLNNTDSQIKPIVNIDDDSTAGDNELAVVVSHDDTVDNTDNVSTIVTEEHLDESTVEPFVENDVSIKEEPVVVNKPEPVVDEPFVDPTDGFKDMFDSDTNADLDVSVADFDDVDLSLPDEDISDDEEESDDDSDDIQDEQDDSDEDDYEDESDEDILRKQTALHNHKNKPKSVSNPVYDKAAAGESILKKFPKSLINLARASFPEDKIQNNTEAVAAYIYYKEGCPPDANVPQSIKALAKFYNKDGVTTEELQDTFESNLQDVDRRLKELLRIANAIELAVAYNICDRIGFRTKDQTQPGELEFLEKSVMDLVKRLDDQSKLNQSRISARHGREFR